MTIGRSGHISSLDINSTYKSGPTGVPREMRAFLKCMPDLGTITAEGAAMANPWLAIPLEDYEGHMRSDSVRQLEPLSSLFKCALDFCVPKSVAILGVAGGNGLEQIDPSTTKRIIGLDINPRYLEAARHRYGTLSGLELCCTNLADEHLGLGPVELVHAALVFEHTGLGRCLDNAVHMVELGGKLSVVLQLPSGAEPDVALTGYSSMQSLRDCFELIDVTELCLRLEEKQFHLVHREGRSLPSGKAFWLGIFAHRVG